MWPTQFMSKAFRRISFVISQFPRLGGCSAFANVAGLGAGRDAELQGAVRARGCVSRRRARYDKVNDQATAAGWHQAGTDVRRCSRMPAYKRTALGGAGAGRRFFAGGADNVVPANISDVPGLVASGWLPIDIVLVQVSGSDDAGRYNAGLGIEHLQAAIGRARLLIAQVNPELPWTYGDTVIEPGVR